MVILTRKKLNQQDILQADINKGCHLCFTVPMVKINCFFKLFVVAMEIMYATVLLVLPFNNLVYMNSHLFILTSSSV